MEDTMARRSFRAPVAAVGLVVAALLVEPCSARAQDAGTPTEPTLVDLYKAGKHDELVTAFLDEALSKADGTVDVVKAIAVGDSLCQGGYPAFGYRILMDVEDYLSKHVDTQALVVVEVRARLEACADEGAPKIQIGQPIKNGDGVGAGGVVHNPGSPGAGGTLMPVKPGTWSLTAQPPSVGIDPTQISPELQKQLQQQRLQQGGPAR